MPHRLFIVLFFSPVGQRKEKEKEKEKKYNEHARADGAIFLQLPLLLKARQGLAEMIDTRVMWAMWTIVRLGQVD